MISTPLLNSAVQDFIRSYEGDLSKLAFAGSPFADIPIRELIQQIESRRKIEKKLPRWFATPKILFPPKLNLEQSSSEITAEYKASLVQGETLADMTGGFGIDSFYFSKKFGTVFHFELDETLSEITSHNFKILNINNVIFSTEDGLANVLKHKYDVVFSDPSRRHEGKGKVFFLKDCQPNIPENIGRILNQCNTFLLKTSPMLDISVGIKELEKVSEIHVVAVENEVKELLWLLKKDVGSPIKIRTVNFTKSKKETFNFMWNEISEAPYGLPQKYLYEPNAAILKSGAFDLLPSRLRMVKLHKNTHLYTGNTLIDFPGRRFYIEKRVPYRKSEMKAALEFKKANIAIRNFPDSVNSIRKKWNLSDGGETYLFFVTNMEDKKEMLICTKL